MHSPGRVGHGRATSPSAAALSSPRGFGSGASLQMYAATPSPLSPTRRDPFLVLLISCVGRGGGVGGGLVAGRDCRECIPEISYRCHHRLRDLCSPQGASRFTIARFEGRARFSKEGAVGLYYTCRLQGRFQSFRGSSASCRQHFRGQWSLSVVLRVAASKA